MRFRVCLLGLAAWTVPVIAGEYALLANGGRLAADRHEYLGSKVRLYSGTGWSELEASQVKGFEEEKGGVPQAEPGPASKPPAGGELAIPDLVSAAAAKYGLPPGLLHSLIRAESGYRVGAVSPKGARGLMQLMPETARAFGIDAADPQQNIDAGARYLWQLLWKYNGWLRPALAAYNAGPGAVDRYRGIPPYRETRAYVERVERNAGLKVPGGKSLISRSARRNVAEAPPSPPPARSLTE